MDNLAMLNGKVLVMRLDDASASSGPFKGVANANLGIIQHDFDPLCCEAGDKVYFGKEYQEIQIGSNKVLVMDSSNLIARVRSGD